MFNKKLLIFKNKNNLLFNELNKISMYYHVYFYLFSKKYNNQFKFVFFDNPTIPNLVENYIMPNNKNYKEQITLNFFYIYIKNSFFSYRHFFGYYRFAKNRNNITSAKCTSLFYKNFLFKYIYKKTFKIYSGTDKNIALILEFFNKLWYFKWKFIWRLANKKFIDFYANTPKYKKKNFKIAVKFALKNRAMTFRPRKVKKNKKKVVLPTDIFNIGFFFKFTVRFKKLFIKGRFSKDNW